MAILKDLTQQPTPERASAPTSQLTIKVSEKGAVSVYGLQRWPVTLYADQWRAVLAHSADILSFIDANAHRLSVKE